MSIISKFQLKSRNRKFELFFKEINPGAEDIILNVGAIPRVSWSGPEQLEDNYPWPTQILGGGNEVEGIFEYRKCYPESGAIVFDGCYLPFKDNSIDTIFSNAVIEHLETFENQRLFAQEIKRVGKKWFITTPNFWFPIELHYRLPFIHWFPKKTQFYLKKFIGGRFPRGVFFNELCLLSRTKLKKLFPDSTVIKQRITLYPETLISYYNGKLSAK
ncbi:methyltransferase domain-containing protein [candidate division CSSED10-310 bacterium]|uniref:Methyltransferase domain-containing protein n=1 Tax=candidate division CSSED10-310 bacterium TaxID=2855610 RepID=A0ABV6YZG9_UNCC1